MQTERNLSIQVSEDMPQVYYQFGKKEKCTRTGCIFYHVKQRLRKPPGLSNGNEHSYLGGVDEAERRESKEIDQIMRGLQIVLLILGLVEGKLGFSIDHVQNR